MVSITESPIMTESRKRLAQGSEGERLRSSSMSSSRCHAIPENGAQQGEQTDNPRPAKRARVAVACTRCKTRKQKCDGITSGCANCKSVSAPCEYIVPSKSMPYGKYQYVKAIETRVAELETVLADAGLTDSDKDHWQSLQNNQTGPIAPPNNSITSSPGATRTEIADTTSPPNRLNTEHGSVATINPNTLPMETGGGYVGDESPKITAGNLFRSVARGKEATLLSPRIRSSSPSDPKPTSQFSEYSDATLEIERTPTDIAETLLKAYKKHISTRWPALYPLYIRKLYERRADLQDPFDISTLNLVYAIAGRFLETTGEVGNFFPERHYAAAVSRLDEILQAHDMRSVQTLLLHAVYCLRAPRGLSAWTHVGLAIRICIELGMHRKSQATKPSLAIEMRKRIFWSCYCLDRQVSIILGRPFAISDRDIDVELPMDIDDSIDEASLCNHTTKPTHPKQSTSLSCFIHTVRLRKIESAIQQSVYRIDKSTTLPLAVIDRFLKTLSHWKANIPSPISDTDSDPSTISFEGYDYYMTYYNKTLRLLLYPHLTTLSLSPSNTNQTSATPNTNPFILTRCAQACSGVCQAYKRLHHQTTVGFSLIALYSVFISGLTLLYCCWLSPSQIYNIQTSNDLNACSIVLYIITERWPGARKYRDAFEGIKGCVVDLITSGSEGEDGGKLALAEPRKRLVLDGVEEGVRRLVFEVMGLHPEGRAECRQMMRDMIGEVDKDVQGGDHMIRAGQASSYSISDETPTHQQHRPRTLSRPTPPPTTTRSRNRRDRTSRENVQNGGSQQMPASSGSAGIGTVSFGEEAVSGEGEMLLLDAMDLLDHFDMEAFLGNPNPDFGLGFGFGFDGDDDGYRYGH